MSRNKLYSFYKPLSWIHLKLIRWHVYIKSPINGLLSEWDGDSDEKNEELLAPGVAGWSKVCPSNNCDWYVNTWLRGRNVVKGKSHNLYKTNIPAKPEQHACHVELMTYLVSVSVLFNKLICCRVSWHVMPQLTVAYLKGQGGTGQGKREGWDCACKWMEEVKEDKEGEPADRSQEPQR